MTVSHLSFTHAANELHLTQGAISRQIASLERYLGFKLFHRHARGLRLTEKGEQLLPLMETLFNDLETSLETVSADRQNLKLKVSTCSMHWFLALLNDFQQEYPEYAIEVTTTFDHNADFSKDNYHAAIIYGQQVEHAHQHWLFDERLIPVCAPTLIKTPLTELDELSKFCWLHPTSDQRDWDLWMSENYMGGLQASQNLQFESMDLAIQAALQGYGISMADRTLVKGDVQSGRLIIPFDRPILTGKSYYLVYPTSSKQQPSLKALLTWIHSSL